MISRETVLEIVRSAGRKPLGEKELAARLSITPDDLPWLIDLLEHLQAAGEIIRLKDGRWDDPSRWNMAAGRLTKNTRGFGFVSVPGRGEEDIFIPGSGLSDAMDGDTVLVKLRTRRGGKNKDAGPSGRVVKILERAHTTFVGTFRPLKGKYAGAVSPDNPSVGADIFIEPGMGGKAGDGSRVLAEITGRPRRGGGVIPGKVLRVLGEENTPEIDEISIMHQFSLPGEFPGEALAEAEAIPFEPSREQMEGRKDLSNILTVAVDPENARDCDDALSMFRDKKTGQDVVLVHIADVSCHVRPGSLLDAEARKRGLSVYLVQNFVPMLPREATQKKLSLSEKGKRAAKTVELRFDSGGGRVSSRIYRSAVMLDARMTYGEVMEILERGNSGHPQDNRSRADIRKLILSLDKLARKLRARRQESGSVDLDVPEYELKTGEDGRISAVSRIERDRSHGLVEEFMLSANTAVAAYLKEKKLPGLYRVHDEPEEEELKEFGSFVENVLGRGIDPFNRGELQKLLTEVRGTDFEEAVNMELLRCMKRARYSPECRSHFALNFPAYCHFTSPVRRYPDLAVHQVLDEHFDAGAAGKGKTRWQTMLGPIAQHCSSAEEKAAEAEREIVKVKLLRFLEDRGVGENEVFDGIITGVKKFGFFARLKDLSIEGMVGINVLGDDTYRYNPSERALVGVGKGRVFRLGQHVRLLVERIDTARRRLDLKPAEVRSAPPS